MHACEKIRAEPRAGVCIAFIAIALDIARPSFEVNLKHEWQVLGALKQVS